MIVEGTGSLTKARIVERLSQDMVLEKINARRFTAHFFELVKDILCMGRSVKFSGFGHFKLRYKSERPGLNPKTKAFSWISARCVVVFKPSKNLKMAVQKKNMPFFSNEAS